MATFFVQNSNFRRRNSPITTHRFRPKIRKYSKKSTQDVPRNSRGDRKSAMFGSKTPALIEIKENGGKVAFIDPAPYVFGTGVPYPRADYQTSVMAKSTN